MAPPIAVVIQEMIEDGVAGELFPSIVHIRFFSLKKFLVLYFFIFTFNVKNK